MTDRLSAYLNGVQERLQAAERERAVAVAREAEQRKKRQAQRALAAAVVGPLLGGGAFAFWRNEQAQAGRERDARTAEAVAASPDNVAAHHNLGVALIDKGDVGGAIASFRTVVELTPKAAWAHNSLGAALHDEGKGDVGGAIASYRKAIELDPKYAHAHYNLGNALGRKSDVDGGSACFRKAIEFDPKFTFAHENLGIALRDKGDVAKRFPALLRGDTKPVDNAERLAFSWVAHDRKHFALATDLYAAAFAADPRLADDLASGRRHKAACCAALAADGGGADAPKLAGNERARLREQALGWLRAGLALRTKQLESGTPADRTEVRANLLDWQKDTDLASIRDKDAVAKLPADEQKAFARLWADVAAVLTRAESPAPPAAKPPAPNRELAPPPREKT